MRALAILAVLGLTVAPAAPPVAKQGPDPDPIVTAAIRASSARGVLWLRRAQNADGSWGDNLRTPGQVGNTCIATLALMATGSTTTRGEHWQAIRRAMRWLRTNAENWGHRAAPIDQGTLLQRKLGSNIDLYLLTLLYSQAMGNGIDAHDERVARTQMRAGVDRITKFQKPNGEWETSYEPTLTTITAWLALRQAHDAGITIRESSADKVVEYLKTVCLDPKTGIFKDQKWGQRIRFVTQAGALRVLCGMGEFASPIARKATDVLLKMSFHQDVGGKGREGGEEFLGALFSTQALHIERGAAFEAWYPKICQQLMACQNRDGSWVGHHCITGRVFCTACSVMSLLTPDQMLPMVDK